MADDEAPRRLKLTGDVRLDGDKIAVRAMVFRGAMHIASEDVFVSVNDASVLQAQLSRVLNEASFPGMEQSEREKVPPQYGF